MNTAYQGKPEYALKRAEELEKLKNPREAVRVLHAALTNRKNRNSQQSTLDVLEKIMKKYLTLCVSLRDGKGAKDGLHQYKTICQPYPNITPLESVVKHFLALAEDKATEAQSKADKIVLDVEDLEAEESIESVMLSSVSGEDSKDRTDREVVTPWLKFLWETYRTILEIVRNNNKLEGLYQETAQRAFTFCLKYKRNTEFRRLCVMLRNHLAFLSEGGANQTHAINLNVPESLQRHLSTRFAQLDTAVGLELWGEAFKSIEDIHNLLRKSRRAPHPSIVPLYYQKLAQIFWISQNYIFHAYAMVRYLLLTKNSGKALSEEEFKTVAGSVVLAVLSIPPEDPNEDEYDDERNERKIRMGTLLTFTNSTIIPRREHLLSEAQKLVKYLPAELADLQETFEKFNPLRFSSLMGAKLQYISSNDAFKQYAPQLRRNSFFRQLQQFSKVFETMKMTEFYRLVTLGVTKEESERLIVEAVRAKHVELRVDHQKGILNFRTQMMESTQMKNQLIHLSKNLNSAVKMIQPTPVEGQEKGRKKKEFTDILQGLAEEHKRMTERKKLIAKKISEREEESRKKAQAEEEERLKKAEEDRRENEKKLALAAEERRVAQKQREEEEKKLQSLKIFADNLKSKTGQTVDVDELSSKGIDQEEFLRRQNIELEKKMAETVRKYKNMEKEMNWLERARRDEERPLIEEHYNKHKNDDEVFYKEQMEQFKSTHKSAYEKDLAEKKRLSKYNEEFMAFENKIMSKRKEEYEAKAAEMQKQNEIKQQKAAEERKKREREEGERAAEAERRRKEEEEEERRKKEEAEKKRREEDERLKKLKEVQELQRKREEAALAKMKETTREPVRETGGRYEPPRRDFGSRDAPRDFSSRDAPRDFGRDRDAPRDFGRDRDAPRDFGSRDAPRDFGRDRDAPRDFGRDRDAPRDFGRDRDAPRDFGRDRDAPRDFGSRDAPRDFGRDRDAPRDFGRDRDAPRDFGRDRDAPRDFGRDRDAPRDFGRDRDAPRDFGSRDAPRDFGSRDAPRDFGRDSGRGGRDGGRYPERREEGRYPERREEPRREEGRYPERREEPRRDSRYPERREEPRRDEAPRRADPFGGARAREDSSRAREEPTSRPQSQREERGTEEKEEEDDGFTEDTVVATSRAKSTHEVAFKHQESQLAENERKIALMDVDILGSEDCHRGVIKDDATCVVTGRGHAHHEIKANSTRRKTAFSCRITLVLGCTSAIAKDAQYKSASTLHAYFRSRFTLRGDVLQSQQKGSMELSGHGRLGVEVHLYLLPVKECRYSGASIFVSVPVQEYQASECHTLNFIPCTWLATYLPCRA
ncbi:hypothetical protein PROFUN_10117 [Planoprotostelium fungivorum]|uniref:Eukaryotic translation initiation factor 3 subunit A n=1 Tax=Planoprotostelium fungivorum TaxID=1890364 RepID=A0A2P6NEN9_9EUKA|nr:hypothetical protein PROFUN_10117 [Planoprotostelium fungivorum]